MSNAEARGQAEGEVLQAFDGLEEAVEATLSRIGALEGDLEEARRQASEMEDLLRKFTGGEEAPSEMVERLRRLEDENRDLLDRLDRGREGVRRLLARIRFLEEQG